VNKIHGNTKPEKARLKRNLMNRLKTLYVMFPSNHPLHVEYAHTCWDIPPEVLDKIWVEVQGAMVIAYQGGYRKGYEKGLIDGAVAVATKDKEEGKDGG
jgi:hypothetical protein